jgi:Na+-transporting NADH:ubiquinone oxidoreductase subunit F
MNRWLYAIHKWVSAAAFLQLSVWTVTGFLFSAIPQSSLKSAPVEGAHRGVITSGAEVSIARVLEIASTTTGAVERVELRGTPAGPFYVVRGETATVRLDARSGRLAPVERAEAESIARRDQPNAPAVRETTRLGAGDVPPIEYRDCESGDCALPAYRVALADAAGTVVYVDATTGDVTTRRNDRWRTYDWLWSLHIMDYKGREDFNHVLIRLAAVLAVATVLSGIVLLSVRATRWTQRRLRATRRGGAA